MLSKEATTEEFSVVQKEGERNVTRKVLFYNLDAVISTGYIVSSTFLYNGEKSRYKINSRANHTFSIFWWLTFIIT